MKRLNLSKQKELKMANEQDLYSFLSMCELFDEVKEKCVAASNAMVSVCAQAEENKDASINLSKLADKRGQMIRFLESLQIKILEASQKEWETNRENQICAQRMDHFNRGVIRWSLEMENLESLLQAKLEEQKTQTRAELSQAFKKSKQHKGYDLNNIR